MTEQTLDPARFILNCSTHGWVNLIKNAKTHLCVFYIDQKTLELIAKQNQRYGQNSSKWEDRKIAHIFDCSVYAQTAALSKSPGIGGEGLSARLIAWMQYGWNIPAYKKYLSRKYGK